MLDNAHNTAHIRAGASQKTLARNGHQENNRPLEHGPCCTSSSATRVPRAIWQNQTAPSRLQSCRAHGSSSLSGSVIRAAVTRVPRQRRRRHHPETGAHARDTSTCGFFLSPGCSGKQFLPDGRRSGASCRIGHRGDTPGETWQAGMQRRRALQKMPSKHVPAATRARKPPHADTLTELHRPSGLPSAHPAITAVQGPRPPSWWRTAATYSAKVHRALPRIRCPCDNGMVLSSRIGPQSSLRTRRSCMLRVLQVFCLCGRKPRSAPLGRAPTPIAVTPLNTRSCCYAPSPALLTIGVAASLQLRLA